MISLSWILGLNCYISERFCPFCWRILDSLSFLRVFLYGLNITVRWSRLSSVARATCPD